MNLRQSIRRSIAPILVSSLVAISGPLQAQFSGDVDRQREAAISGDARAQTLLGNRYHDGWGVEKDIAKALEWYAKAAAQGYADGQFRLGHEYATGHGVARDVGKAIELFTQAAQQGHAEAQHRLGEHYENGRGVARDPDAARRWYEQSAAGGFPKAQVAVAARYVDQREFEKALDLYQQAAAQRNREAMTFAGIMHLYGMGTPENPAKAAEYFRPVVASDIKAKMFYGMLLLDGQGVEQDTETGGKYLTEAAQHGIPDAMFALAEAMYSGLYQSPGAGMAAAYSNTSPRELMKQEARQWYEKSALAGHEAAKAKLREYYP